MIRLSNHFVENWQKRVGNYPTLEQIRGIKKGSIKVQEAQYFRIEGGKPYNTLTIFWHAGLGLIMSYDPKKQVMVSVLTRENWKNKAERQNAKVEKHDGYVPMTMHQ